MGRGGGPLYTGYSLNTHLLLVPALLEPLLDTRGSTHHLPGAVQLCLEVGYIGGCGGAVISLQVRKCSGGGDTRTVKIEQRRLRTEGGRQDAVGSFGLTGWKYFHFSSCNSSSLSLPLALSVCLGAWVVWGWVLGASAWD